MKLIVGLGNPGREYESSRHNVGWLVLDCLSKRWQISMDRERFRGLFGDGQILGQRVGLLKPLVYMNRSGASAAAAVQFYKLDRDAFLVVSDDLNLPLGRLRIRAAGSAGGHNGLADIIERLATDQFARLRVGIGQSSGDMVAHVLSAFAPEETAAARAAIETAADAVECWISEGIEQAMNRFNAPPATQTTDQDG